VTAVQAVEPVAPTCEKNLSPKQLGIVFEWNTYPKRVFGSRFKSGSYSARYRRYSFPYLYGVKAGRENVFEPAERSLLFTSADFSYVLVEDTLITPTVMAGGEVTYSRNLKSQRIAGLSLHAIFSKEINRVMPYFGPVLEYSKINDSAFSASDPGVSYGLSYTFSALSGWSIYFNNSW